MAHRSGLHLLEVGLFLPPETFLRWKLDGLEQRGVRLTIHGTPSARRGELSLPGARLIAAPRWEESRTRALLGVSAGVARVGLRRPAALRATIRAARNPIRGGRGEGWLTFVRRLRSYLPLALVRPDVAHFEWNSSAIHYLPMADVWRCATVISAHGTEVNIRPHQAGAESYRRWLSMSFDRAAGVHCVSSAIAEQAAALGMDSRRAWLIRNAVDPEVFQPSPGDGDPPGEHRPLRVISVADFRWVKGQEYVVRVIAQLVRRGVPVQLEMIGGDPADGIPEASDRARVEHAVARLGLTEHVRLSGALAGETIPERLQAADVLLHTSLSEGLPTVVLEAMACGLPVVASRSGGVPEAVSDGVEGFIVPVRDVGKAADALHTLSEDEDLRRRMGRAARARVLSEFTLNRQLDEFLIMYEALRAGSPTTMPTASPHERQLRVLTVAPLAWTQGLDDGMQALALVRARGIDGRQRIFGEGPYRDALQFTRRQLDLEAWVELRDPEQLRCLRSGALTTWPDHASRLRACADWQRQLEWADVLLDASLCDPPVASIAAAQQAGVPVITTSRQSPPTRPMSSLRHVDPGEPEMIAQALQAVASESMAPLKPISPLPSDGVGL